MLSPPLDSVLSALRWRYATKHFDPERRISPEDWRALEESLILTPSSYGLQPWRFLVVTTPEVKERLLPHCWRQRQVVDCSHLLVMAVRRTIDEPYIDRFFERHATVRGVQVDSLSGYRGVVVRDLISGERSAVIPEWAARQAYIALGQFLLSAAMAGIDTCPMEGFMASAVDRELDLDSRDLTAAVLCPAGYRAATDRYADLPKVRWDHEEVIEHR